MFRLSVRCITRADLSVFNVVQFIFFFKQKTAYGMRISDWSSDVCSSDLLDFGQVAAATPEKARPWRFLGARRRSIEPALWCAARKARYCRRLHVRRMLRRQGAGKQSDSLRALPVQLFRAGRGQKLSPRRAIHEIGRAHV